MAEISHAKRIIGDVTGKAPAADTDMPWRKGIGKDNAGGLPACCLSLRKRDGRHQSGPPMNLLTWHEWMDNAGPTERLFLFFSVGAVYVEGLHLKFHVESVLQEGKLKWIQEHDRAEVEAIRAHNLDKRNAEEKEPIVLRILISPDLETRLKMSKHLAPIIEAMKGDTDETGESGNAE
jgi:hypothetical protein